MLEGSIVLAGFVASLAAGLATGIGAALIFAVRKLSEKTEDVLLSGAAGVMLAATFFSLILPAIDSGEEVMNGRVAAVSVVIAGILIGALTLWLIHEFTPHEHLGFGREGPLTPRMSRVMLFVLAITIHNFPEGMAVGVGVAGSSLRDGVSIAVGIGLQNIPEGLAVAAALLGLGFTRMKSFLGALATGFVEPVGGLLGSAAISAARPMMPLTLGFAAGAMLFIISDEIIPETHRRGFETAATFSLMIGFATMMFLDATLS